jgi:hypothetical protein
MDFKQERKKSQFVSSSDHSYNVTATGCWGKGHDEARATTAGPLGTSLLHSDLRCQGHRTRLHGNQGSNQERHWWGRKAQTDPDLGARLENKQ